MALQKSFFLFVLVLSVLWLPGAGTARAGFDADGVEVFVPTSAWLIGPASVAPVSDAGFSMPCIMMNQYNNGFVFRFSGGGGRIMAMALDFRQDAFETGETYLLKIEVPPTFSADLPATAHNKGTVLINLQRAGGFYEALKGGKYLNLTIGGQRLSFAMLGIKEGLERVENCYNPVPQASSGQPREAAANRGTFNLAADIAPGYIDKVRTAPPPGPSLAGTKGLTEENLTPIPGGDMPAEEALPALEQRLAALDQMLSSAAQRLSQLQPSAMTQQQTQPPPQQQPVINSQVQPDPAPASFQPQVDKVPAQPIGRPLASTWTQPVRKGGMSQQPVEQQAEPSAVKTASYLPQIRRWRAMHGSNLREVLDVWTGSENARLIWRSDREYSIPRSFSLEGTFEQVVANILDLYGEERVRPVGRIYYNPDTGQKILLVESY